MNKRKTKKTKEPTTITTSPALAIHHGYWEPLARLKGISLYAVNNSEMDLNQLITIKKKEIPKLKFYAEEVGIKLDISLLN